MEERNSVFLLMLALGVAFTDGRIIEILQKDGASQISLVISPGRDGPKSYREHMNHAGAEREGFALCASVVAPTVV
jgi:hypothetical protein